VAEHSEEREITFRGRFIEPVLSVRPTPVSQDPGEVSVQHEDDVSDLLRHLPSM